jgi:Spy/CpxP family protein refolding chaperone
MDISVKDLQEAISIRQQIDNLQRRLSSLLRGAPQRPTAPSAPSAPTARTAAGRYFSPTTRAKLAAAARARWARRRGTGGAAPAKTKGQLTPAGRRKLSQLMKARWAARRKAGGKQKTPSRKKGALTPAGRRRLSELMKARWAARRKAGSK